MNILMEKYVEQIKGIGLIKKLRNRLSRKHLLTIYKSHIRPHLDYADIIYVKPYIQTFVSKLESAKYNDYLAITGAIRGTSKERIYQELGIESLANRRWYRRMCLFWKIVNGLSLNYLTSYLPPIQFSRYPERQNIFSAIPRATNYFANSFFPNSVD